MHNDNNGKETLFSFGCRVIAVRAEESYVMAKGGEASYISNSLFAGGISFL
jgi:hypothetical protein